MNPKYFIRSTLLHSDPWGETRWESGIFCYVDEQYLLECYKLVKEKTLNEYTGSNLAITIGIIRDNNRCDIIYSSEKSFSTFDGDLTIIDEDINFSGFTFELTKIEFNGTTFQDY